MCEPDDGYYYVSEYSPEFRHGSAANFYVKKNLDVVIDPDYSGNEPILPTTQAFEKCDDTCFGCRGSSVKDCTACYPGKRLNVDRNYRRDRDPYPYGTCELQCETSKFSATTPTSEETSDQDTFWTKKGGWICKNCHHTCYDCSGLLDSNCYECRYPDSVLKTGRNLAVDPHIVQHLNLTHSNTSYVHKSNGMSNGIRQIVNLDEGRCLNCSIAYNDNPELCFMTRELSLRLSDKPIDGFSATSVRVNLGNDRPELNNRLRALDWNKLLGLRIEGLQEGIDYEHRFEYFRGQLFVSLNFTKDGGVQNLIIKPLNNTVLSSPHKFIPEISTPDFLLADKEASLEIVSRKAEDAATIQRYSGKGSIDFGGMSAVTNTISSFLLVVSLLASSGPLAGPMLNMIKVFKLVYSLRLINVYFGNILEAFLSALSQGFGNIADADDKSIFYFTKTRGKLTVYDIGVLSNYYLYLKYLMIFFTRLFGLMSDHFKRKIKRAQSLDYSHLVIINIIEMLRTSIFYSSVYDVALYTVHELLHHDLTLNQSSLARVSYVTAFGVFILTTYELINALEILRNFKVNKLNKILRHKETMDKQIFDANLPIQERWNLIQKRDTFNRNFNYVYGMNKMFFLTGIELGKVGSFILRGVKFFSVLKIIIFSILINCLQTTPRIQISLILLIQLVYTGFVIWTGLVKKIYTSFFFTLIEFASEISILVFLLIGAIIKYVGRDNLNQGFSTMIQLIAIFLILISTLLNLGYSLAVLIKAALGIREILKFTSIRKKVNSEYEAIQKEQEQREQRKKRLEEKKLGISEEAKNLGKKSEILKMKNINLPLPNNRPSKEQKIQPKESEKKKELNEDEASKLGGKKPLTLAQNKKLGLRFRNKFIQREVQKIKQKRLEIYERNRREREKDDGEDYF